MATPDIMGTPNGLGNTEGEATLAGPVRFPSVVALKHGVTGHFLGVITQGDYTGQLAYHSSNNPQNPQSQFDVHFPTTEPGISNGDMHFRSRFNNKYVTRGRGEFAAVRATADVRGSEYNTQECTVFRAYTMASSKIALYYMGNLYYLGESGGEEDSSDDNMFLCTRSSSPASPPRSEMEAVEVIVNLKLPKVICFKCDNGNFLQAQQQDEQVFNVFNCTDLAQPRTMYETFPTSRNNYFRIKSYFYDKFLRRGDGNWILSDSSDESENGDLNTLFEVLKSPQDNAVLLLNQGNDLLCARVPEGDLLDAGTGNTRPAPPEANLEVAEPVVSRTIIVLPDDFRMGEATVFNHELIEMDRKIASNPDNVTRMVTMELSYTKGRSGNWDNAESIKWGGEAEFRSDVPQIVSDSEVGIEGVREGLYRWGTYTREVGQRSIFRLVVVPPKTEIHVTVVGKKASCKVPFSYLQTDVLAYGPNRVYKKDDGLYSGICTYGFDIKEESKSIG